jgi:hypothetical protein
MPNRFSACFASLLLLSFFRTQEAAARDSSPTATSSGSFAVSSTQAASGPTTPPGSAVQPVSESVTAAVTDGAEPNATVEELNAVADGTTLEQDASEASIGKRRKTRRAPRKRHPIPLRVGAGLFFGGTLPDAAPVLGFAFRAGLQRPRVSFMLEGGLSGAVGGAITSGDTHSSRATVFYHGFVAPTAELNLHPLFVSLGVPLGIGMWSSSRNTVDPSGTVRAEARSTTGLLTFVGGLDARIGRHFEVRGRHHITCALGTKLLLAKEDEATSVIPLRGELEGSSSRGLGLRFVPTLTVGYDYF